MKVLGLDCATRTGFALLDDSGIIDYGKIELNPKDPHLIRFVYFRKEIKKLVEKLCPDVVVIEDTYARNASTAAYLNRLCGIVIGVVPKSVTILIGRVSTMRSQVVGKQSKEDVFNWAVSKYELSEFVFKKDNDITDAILLAFWGMDQCQKN